jgi:hypothetical protein
MHEAQGRQKNVIWAPQTIVKMVDISRAVEGLLSFIPFPHWLFALVYIPSKPS